MPSFSNKYHSSEVAINVHRIICDAWVETMLTEDVSLN